MTVGRLPENDLQITDTLASRRHASLEIYEQKVVLTDLGSNNGTWVNEQRIAQPVELKDGDRVKIGETLFTFKAPRGDSQPAPSESPRQPSGADGSTMMWETSTLLTLVRASDGAEFGLTRSMRVGRDESADLLIKDDPSVSQFHAQFEIAQGQVFIADMNSRNGVWVNGKRITGKVPLKHGDKIHIGKTVFRLRVGDQSLPPLDAAAAPRKSSSWIGWTVVSGIAALALIVACVAAVSAFVSATSEKPTAVVVLPTSSAPDTAEIAKIKQEALRSLALIVVPDQNYKKNDTWYIGSGSFINEQGYILTNFHVVGFTEGTAQEAGRNTGDMLNTLYEGGELVLAGVNWENPVEKPNVFYRCEIVDRDPYLDLALLRVVESYDIEAETPFPISPNTRFVPIKIGNSDNLKILEPITIIGYPGVGGYTPTAIDDQVAGFAPDEDYDVKNGWIKTGPVIGHGNSGGMAINQQGELIGVPTMIITNETDKIGYIRPVNLALSMIQGVLP